MEPSLSVTIGIMFFWTIPGDNLRGATENHWFWVFQAEKDLTFPHFLPK